MIAKFYYILAFIAAALLAAYAWSRSPTIKELRHRWQKSRQIQHRVNELRKQRVNAVNRLERRMLDLINKEVFNRPEMPSRKDFEEKTNQLFEDWRKFYGHLFMDITNGITIDAFSRHNVAFTIPVELDHYR